MIKQDIVDLAIFLHKNPELSGKEFLAANEITKLLMKYNFSVECGVAAMPTAFVARYGSAKRPCVAFCAEYDALPSIGHACGHNLIAASSVGAGIILSKSIDSNDASIVVLGTPAEETYGGKIKMLNVGLFNGIDVVMMSHPSDMDRRSGTSMAYKGIEVSFYGRASHAAYNPEDGINALDAAILTFNGISMLRQYLNDKVLIHGIITNGGKLPGIIPDLSQIKLYVRATNMQIVKDNIASILNIIDSAAKMVGCTYDYNYFEQGFSELITNQTLANLYYSNYKLHAGNTIVGDAIEKISLDIGDVSHVVPCIHPYFAICETKCGLHSQEFAQAAKSPFALEQMLQVADVLAKTGWDVIRQPSLLNQIKEEFAQINL